MICLVWWQWLLLLIVGGWCQRLGGGMYDRMKAWYRHRHDYSLLSSSPKWPR